MNANSLAILHDCKPNRSDVHSAGPTAALPVPSLHAVPVTMSAPHCIMSSPSLKLFQSGILSILVPIVTVEERLYLPITLLLESTVNRGGIRKSSDNVASGIDSDHG